MTPDPEPTTKTTPAESATILVVDDQENNRELLHRRLRRDGHTTLEAVEGGAALRLMSEKQPDLVLLDIMMPEMDGYEVLERRAKDAMLKEIPVVVISAVTELESIVRCVKLGADDYLFKPFEPTLLRARVEACMDKKRRRDAEKEYVHRIEQEKEKTHRLLVSVLPEEVVDRLCDQAGGSAIIADKVPAATVLFAEVADLPSLTEALTPDELVRLLNDVFCAFDGLCDEHGVEKIKTVGGAYMAAAGLPLPCEDHAQRIAELSLQMQRSICRFDTPSREPLRLRIGINSGQVTAGVIGRSRLSYDLWGQTVETASNLRTHGITGSIQISDSTFELIKDTYMAEKRGGFVLDSGDEIVTYLLQGRIGH
ncbi:MAG: adenylate/guanylate cyclase domain-containing protein [Phycisphaeraceae bacterium]